MKEQTDLNIIRKHLFHGLSDYTKSFPDFSIPQRFLMASPKEGKKLLDKISSSLAEEEEILLYVHLPFCSSECVFCNAFPWKASQDIQEKYIQSLLGEIEIYSEAGMFDGKRIKCIYIGGGTPTAFSNSDIQTILEKIKSRIDLTEDCNITSEAHPKDLIKNERLEGLSDLGINRVSMGCQTFDPRVLRLCKRSNPESQVKEVIWKAKNLGMSTNIDMMLGLPGQTLEGVRRDLDILSEIVPDSIEYMRHEIVNPLAISIYQSDPELVVKDDELFWMTFHTQEWMEANGYEQNGHFRSEKYFPYRYHWLNETPFIALGSRSRSYTKAVCYDKHEDLSLYQKLIEKGVPPIARYMVLDKKEQMYRSLFLHVQIEEGLDLRRFKDRFGEDALAVFSSLLKRMREFGCLAEDDSSIRLSRYGKYFVEDICCLIIDHALDENEYPAHLKRVPHSSGGSAIPSLEG